MKIKKFILTLVFSILTAGIVHAQTANVQMLPPTVANSAIGCSTYTAANGSNPAIQTANQILSYNSYPNKNSSAINCNSNATIDSSGNVNSFAVSGNTIHFPINNYSGGPFSTTQGGYLAWNQLTGGTGETDFINNPGNGTGGFAFMNSSSNASIMLLDSAGNLNANGQITSLSPSAAGSNIRMVGGTYGAMWRNDGTNLYLLFTDSGLPYGTWNSLRPLYFNLATGQANFGNATTFTGSATFNSSAAFNNPITVSAGAGDVVNISSNQIWNSNPSASALLLNYSAANNSTVYVGNGNTTQNINVLKGSLCLNGVCITSFPSSQSGLQGPPGPQGPAGPSASLPPCNGGVITTDGAGNPSCIAQNQLAVSQTFSLPSSALQTFHSACVEPTQNVPYLVCASACHRFCSNACVSNPNTDSCTPGATGTTYTGQTMNYVGGIFAEDSGSTAQCTCFH